MVGSVDTKSTGRDLGLRELGNRRLYGLVGVFALAIVVLAATAATLAHQHANNQIDRRLQQVLHTSSLPLGLFFQQTGKVLDRLEAAEHSNGALAALASPHDTSLIGDIEYGVAVVSPAGVIEHNVGPHLVSPQSASIMARDADLAIQVTEPVRQDGAWISTAYRRENVDAADRDAKILTVSFNTDQLAAWWRTIGLPQGASAALVHQGSSLWLQFAAAPAEAESRTSAPPLARAIAQSVQADSGFTTLGASDGKDGQHRVAWTELGIADLTLCSSLSTTLVSQLWWSEFTHLIIYDLATLVVLAAIGAVFCRNILIESTERRRSEGRFRDFGETSSDWFWETDANHRYTYLSRNFERFTGTSASTMLGKPRDEIVTEANDEARQIHREAMANLEPFKAIEITWRAPSGRLHRIRSSGKPMFGRDGRFQGYRGSAVDVTQELEAQTRAEAARTQLIEALESIPYAIALFDADERFVMANARYRDTIDAQVRDLLIPGIRFEDLVREGAKRGLYRIPNGDVETYVAARMADHRRLSCSREHQMGDGTFVRVTEHRTRDGGFVVTMTDITDLKNQAEALRRARDEAESASRAKSEFLANMSHELRTPLNAVLGFSEVMDQELLGALGNERYREYSRDISASASHLLGIINDMLDLARIEAGRFEITEDVLDVEQLVSQCVSFLQPSITKAGVQVVVTAPGDTIGLRADQRAMRQVLLNVLSNACKFSPEGSTIEIAWSCDHDDRLRLSVTDQGEGMSASDVVHAFMPFGQVKNAMTSRREGTGLGLPITRSLLDLHNGEIEIDSTPGKGTTVLITLPTERVFNRVAA